MGVCGYNEADILGIRSFLLEKGFNEYAIAGVLANFYAESRFRANNLQNGFETRLGLRDDEYVLAVDTGAYSAEVFQSDRAGFGLAQWTSGGRKAGLYKFIKERGQSIGDRTTQLEYFWYELNNGYKNVLKALREAKSVDEATRVVMVKYERPASQNKDKPEEERIKAQDVRVCYGLEFYKLYAIKEEVENMSKKILVVLDPGHYPNYNRGAVAGYFEGDKMYDYSEYERDALKAYGIDVILTRGRSNDMALYDRGQVAVKNGKGYDVVIFKSNHSNGFNGSAYGVTVIRSLYLPDSEELGKKLMDAVVGVMKPVTGVTYGRGVITKKGKSGDYYGVIRGSVSGAKSEDHASRGPVTHSFIVEHGFHDNVKECTFLNNASNLKKMAQAEAKAIAEYFGLSISGGSSTQETVKEETTKPETTTELYRVRKSWADSKSQLGAFKSLESAKKLVDENTGYEVYNSAGEVVYPVKAEDKSFKVKIIVDSLNYRSGAGTKYKVNGIVKKGEIYTIVETSGSWGKLKSGAGWINVSSKYVTRL